VCALVKIASALAEGVRNGDARERQSEPAPAQRIECIRAALTSVGAALSRVATPSDPSVLLPERASLRMTAQAGQHR
jgi:hypothetical protein